MPELYTVDASVFVSAFNVHEVGHLQSHEVLEQLKARQLSLLEPILLLPELAASVARVYQDEAMAREFAYGIQSLPNLMLFPLDNTITDLAVEIAVKHRLRGSDSVYVAVALQHGTTLVTLDQEQRKRGSEAVPSQTPSEVLDGMTT